MDFQSKVRTSFQKVKESISELDLRISGLESEIKEIKVLLEQSLHLQKVPEPQPIMSKTPETPKLGVSEPPKPQIQESSTGNGGVLRRQPADNLPTKRRQTDTAPTEGLKDYYDVQTLKKDLESRFLSLTEAQFKVFMAIYRLEEELKAPVTYAELAKELLISQSAVRDYISDLVLRKIPLTKATSPNRKVYLTIKKEFRTLKMLENLLALRAKDHSQTRLTGHLRHYM
jgi:DNA-binding MarR family transcriptional regulator